jgi:hypothetical protein
MPNQAKEFQFTPDQACQYFLQAPEFNRPSQPWVWERTTLPTAILADMARNASVETMAVWVANSGFALEQVDSRIVRAELILANGLTRANARADLVACQLELISLPADGLYLKKTIQAYDDFETDLLAEKGVGMLPSRWYRAMEQNLAIEHWIELGQLLQWAISRPHDQESLLSLRAEERFQAYYRQYEERVPEIQRAIILR